jgi:hypothetical protein
MVDHAIFSKDGPNLNNPAETNRPSVIPNKYRLIKRNAKGRPKRAKIYQIMEKLPQEGN